MNTLNRLHWAVFAVAISITNLLPAQEVIIAQLKKAKGKDYVRIANRITALGIRSPDVQKIFVENLKSKDVNVKAASCDGILFVGDATPAIIEAVFESMKGGGTTWPDAIPYVEVAANVLVEIGKDAMPVALQMLDTDDKSQYMGTMDYIHRMGADAKQAVPELIKRLDPEDKRVWATIYALGGIGRDAREATDELIKFLDSKDFNLVCISCRALAGIGISAKKAKPKLLEVMKKGNISERGRALQALGGIGVATDDDVKPLFEENLNAFHQSLRDRTMMGIANLSPEKAQTFIPLVAAALDDPKFKNKPIIAATLYRIGGSKEIATQTLLKALENPTFEVDAIKKLGEMESGAKAALPTLIGYLDSEDDYLRALTIESIAKIEVTDKVRGKLKVIADTGDYLAARTARKVLKSGMP